MKCRIGELPSRSCKGRPWNKHEMQAVNQLVKANSHTLIRRFGRSLARNLRFARNLYMRLGSKAPIFLAKIWVWQFGRYLAIEFDRWFSSVFFHCRCCLITGSWSAVSRYAVHPSDEESENHHGMTIRLIIHNCVISCNFTRFLIISWLYRWFLKNKFYDF